MFGPSAPKDKKTETLKIQYLDDYIAIINKDRDLAWAMLQINFEKIAGLVEDTRDLEDIATVDPLIASVLLNDPLIEDECKTEHFYQFVNNDVDLLRFPELYKKYPEMVEIILNKNIVYLFKVFATMNVDNPISQLALKSPLCKKIMERSQFFKIIGECNFSMAAELLKRFPDMVKSKDTNQLAFKHLTTSLGLDAKTIEKSTPTLDSLDLATKRPSVQRPIKLLEAKTKSKTEFMVARTFPSLKRYFDLMMYGPSGYYELGILQFLASSGAGKEGDFSTFATDVKLNQAFAANFAYQLFNQRKSLIASRQLKNDERFNVLECGAGNGQLCIQIYKIIEAMAAKNSEWNEFFDCMHYQIVEKAKGCYDSQIKNIQDAKLDSKKITICLGDALQLEKVSDLKKPIHALISNELLDMFPPHGFKKTSMGDIHVLVMIPRISKEQYIKHFLDIAKIPIEELEKKSQSYKESLKHLNPDYLKEDKGDFYILSENDYLKIHKCYMQNKNLMNEDIFKFDDIYVPSEHFPEADRFIRENPSYFHTLLPDSTRNACISTADFIAGAGKVLDKNGMMITIDYGTADDSEFNIRTFQYGVKGKDYKIKPGYIDMTLDVSFSLVNSLGIRNGLETKFYAQQDQLLPSEAEQLFISHNVLTKEQIEHFRKESAKGNFKACVQIKGQSKQLVTHFLGDSLPISYGQLFALKKSGMSDFTMQATVEILREMTASPFCWDREQKGFKVVCPKKNGGIVLKYLEQNNITVHAQSHPLSQELTITILASEIEKINALKGPIKMTLSTPIFRTKNIQF